MLIKFKTTVHLNGNPGATMAMEGRPLALDVTIG